MHQQKAIWQEIIHAYNTPVYIYDSEKIEKNYRVLENHFSPAANIFYSIKANPNIAVAARLRALGAGAEVCSGTELEIAILAGFQPRDIIFVGPAKAARELVRAIELGIYAIVCESKQEFALINELAKTRSVIVNVAIRINPEFAVRDASLKMGGVPSQFGIDQADALAEKEYFLAAKNINLIGVHVFNGTRILSAETFIENTQNILALVDQLEEAWGIEFEMIDIGGGIGVAYFKHELEFDFHQISTENFSLLKDYKKKHPRIRLILESGRFLVASAGCFVTQVMVVKESKGKKFLITDGGMNCHLTAAGFGSIVRRNFPIKLVSETVSEKILYYHITGPLCTPADVIARNIPLPEAKEGDYIVIEASGAYGPSASPVNFLSHGHPAEVLIKNSRGYLVRERDSASDFINKQRNYLPAHH